MKTEEYKQIEDLLERFFEGLTSNEEERLLYDFFARPDIPSHLERYREIFGYFEKGIALDFSETPELKLPVQHSSKRRRLGWVIGICVAASLLLLLINTVMDTRSFSNSPYKGSYIVRNGKKITDLKTIQADLEATYQSAERIERQADQLLRTADDIERLPDIEDQRLEKEYGDLLGNIPNSMIRKEIYEILKSEK